MKNMRFALGVCFLVFFNLANAQPIDDLPDGFPEMTINLNEDPSPGYFFVSPHTGQAGKRFIIILDNNATPVFYRNTEWGGFDFKLQPNGLLTYYDNKKKEFYGLDSYYQVIDTFRVAGSYFTDFHELLVTEEDHVFLIGLDYRLVDMDTVVEGGLPGATVTGCVIQEQDAKGNILFEWNSFDHFQITDASNWVKLADTLAIDYVHANSIAIVSDTNLLISCRNMNEITNIDRRTGEIIWRFNGKNSQFEMINDTLGFAVQHSIRYMQNGNLSIHANSTEYSLVGDERFSSAVEYKLDTDSMTATLVKRIRREPDVFGAYMANTQRLENGNTVIGWGSTTPSVTEFDTAGNMVWDLSFPEVSYRAFKFPEWETDVFDINIDSIQFEDLLLTDSSFLKVTLQNNWNKSIIIDKVISSDAVFSCNTELPVNLDANQSIEFEIEFNPDTIGAYNATLTFCSDSDTNGIIQRIANQLFVSGNGYNDESVAVLNMELIKVYPNPVKEWLTIECEEFTLDRIIIYDIRGKIIETRNETMNEKTTIDFYSLDPGVYFMQIKMHGDTPPAVVRIVKI